MSDLREVTHQCKRPITTRVITGIGEFVALGIGCKGCGGRCLRLQGRVLSSHGGLPGGSSNIRGDPKSRVAFLGKEILLWI